MKEGPTINSEAKTFRVLEFISEKKDGCTLTDLARKLALSMGSAQRIIHILTELKYLSEEPNTKVLPFPSLMIGFYDPSGNLVSNPRNNYLQKYCIES